MLALLALDVGQVITVDRLVEDLWEDGLPQSHVGALRVLVSRLRKTLSRQGSPEVIVTRPEGYLMAGEVSVDASTFKDLLAIGQRQLAVGEFDRASHTLGEALALWRTPQLSEFPGETGRVRKVHLEQVRLAALESRIDADLHRGYGAALIAELQELTASYPYSEGFWRARIISLYRAGRQAEALRTFAELRELLVEELGIDPSPELQQLEAAVLMQDPALLDHAMPSSGGPGPAADPVDRSQPTAAPSGTDEPRGSRLPKRLERIPELGLVGRAEEQHLLAEAMRGGRASSQTDTTLVIGEAGIGKTSLIAAAAREVCEEGIAVLYGRCDEDLVVAFQPFVEALSAYVEGASDNALLFHERGPLAELSRIVPELRRRFPDLPEPTATEPGAERHLLFGAIVAVLADIAATAPAVLILEDLHWADQPTLQLLRHVAGSHRRNWLIVGTYRNTELSVAHPLLELLGALRRDGNVNSVDLVGLSIEDIASLVEAATGHVPDESVLQFADALHRETDGNPFFVLEVMLHLLEEGSITRGTGGLQTVTGDFARAGLPASVREVVGARLARLGTESGAVLAVAATIGDEFDLALLKQVTGRSDDELLDVMDRAAGAALVRESADAPGSYGFAHTLIRQCLQQEIGAARRSRLHRQVAEGLEVICGDQPHRRIGELAHHWVSATQPVDLDKAVRYLRLAGATALDDLAPEEAVTYFAQALELESQFEGPDALRRAELLIDLGRSQRQAGIPAYRQTLLEAAHLASDADSSKHLVIAARSNDRGFFSALGRLDEEKIAVLEMAIERLTTHDRYRSLMLASLCKELAFGASLERRLELGEEAVALADATDDDVIIATVLNDVAISLLVPPQLDQSLARTAESLDRAQRVGDPILIYWSATLRGVVAACATDIDELDRCTEITDSMASRLNQPSLNWIQAFVGATRALIAGDPILAEQRATDALQVGSDAGEPDAMSLFGPQLIGVRFEMGTLGELVPLIEQAAADNPGIPAFTSALALAHVESGRADLALPYLTDLAAREFEFPLNLNWLTGMTLYAEAAIECGSGEIAGPLFEKLAPWSDQMVYDVVTSAGPVSHYVGGLAAALGRYGEAEKYLSQAAALSERVGAKFYGARSHLAWGRALAERGTVDDNARAREHLARAHDAAAANGYRVVEARSAQALARLT